MTIGPQLISDSQARALITLDTPVVRLTVFDTALYVLRDVFLSIVVGAMFYVPIMLSLSWPLPLRAPQNKGEVYGLLLLILTPWIAWGIVRILWRRFRQLVIALRGGDQWFMALSRDHLLLNINPVLYLMPEQKNLTCIDIRVADVKALCRRLFEYRAGKIAVNVPYVLVKLKDMPDQEMVRFIENANTNLNAILKHQYGVPYLFLQGCNLFMLWPQTVHPSFRIAFKLFEKIIPADPAEPYVVNGIPGGNL